MYKKLTTIATGAQTDLLRFFDSMEAAFLQSHHFAREKKTLHREMKLKVWEGDLQMKKAFLEDYRNKVLEEFRATGMLSNIWDECYCMENDDFDKARFINTLLVLRGRDISQESLCPFFKYYCLTNHINLLLKDIMSQIRKHASASEEVIVAEVVQPVETNAEHEVLRNEIFSSRMFGTNARLHDLRRTIAAAIDLGEANRREGIRQQEVCIRPEVKKEWYYVMKCLREAGAMNKGTSVPAFINQMRRWFPSAFPEMTEEEWEAYVGKMRRSLSNEKKLWTYGKQKEEVRFIDIWAKKNLIDANEEKLKWAHFLTNKGLLEKLKELKRTNSPRKMDTPMDKMDKNLQM